MKVAHLKSGFTVIELLAVVMIIAMLAAFTVRGGGLSFGNSVLDTSSNDVVYALRFARLLAIEKQIYVRVTFDQESGKIALVKSVMNEESAEVTQTLVDDRTVKRLQLHKDVQLVNISAMNQLGLDDGESMGMTSEIIFAPNGRSKGVMITLMHQGHRSFVKIAAATGKISIIRGEQNKKPDNLFEVIDLEAM